MVNDTQEFRGDFNSNPPGFIKTTPPTTGWNKLHPVGKNYSLIFVRVRKQATKIRKIIILV